MKKLEALRPSATSLTENPANSTREPLSHLSPESIAQQHALKWTMAL